MLFLFSIIRTDQLKFLILCFIFSSFILFSRLFSSSIHLFLFIYLFLFICQVSEFCKTDIPKGTLLDKTTGLPWVLPRKGKYGNMYRLYVRTVRA